MCQEHAVHTSSKLKALSELDRKRWWVTPEHSLGFSHPDILLILLGCENQRNAKLGR